MKSRLLHVATELGLFVLFCWITLTFLFGIRQMPDNSMYPKLMAGDLILYSRLEKSYHIDDVVSTTVDGEEYFLRVVAQFQRDGWKLEEVEFSDDGFLIINGQTQYEEIMSESLVPEDSTLTYPYQVPYGSYFLLGDARTDCIDSRVFGARTAKEINGKVIGIFRHRQF